MNQFQLSIFALGPLEAAVMEIVWRCDTECSVRSVSACTQPLAYTTIASTLDRLCEKKLLQRRRSAKGYLYSPNVTRDEFHQRKARAYFTEELQMAPTSLMSCFLDSIGHEPALLDHLETLIQQARARLTNRGSVHSDLAIPDADNAPDRPGTPD